jgi:type II secretory pathway pseudopilin PulG
MRREAGFTLIETAVAVLIAVSVVVGVGLLGENLVRQRAIADANSAATSIAEKKMEGLLADPTQNPTGAACPAADLCAGTHGPATVDETLQPALVGYTLQWVVTDNVPYSGAKKLEVTVTRPPNVRCYLVTYAKVS